MLLGFAGILTVDYFYPPLDARAVMLLGLVLFFLPLALLVASRVGAWRDSPALQKWLAWLVPAPAVLCVFLFLNATLDRSPAEAHPVQILQKSYSRARVGTSYYLLVSSWRPGREVENLAVGSRTFRTVQPGERVTVELHPGLFGLPWVGKILPR